MNFVTTIPIGALNISITELSPSSNVLVLKSMNNTFIINNSSLGNYQYFDDIFNYSIENSLEKITSSGPLINAVDLIVSKISNFNR